MRHDPNPVIQHDRAAGGVDGRPGRQFHRLTRVQIWLIGIGLVLAFVYHATKSVTASWVTHAVHNAVSLALMLSAGDSLAGPSELTLQDAGWALLSLLGLILAGGYLWARSGRRLT